MSATAPTTLIGVTEAVDLLAREYGLVVSEHTVRRLCSRRAIAAVQFGPKSHWRIDPESLADLAQHGWQ